MKKSVIAVLILAGVMLANDHVLFAQDRANSTVTGQDVLLRKDLRSQRKQLIAANLPLTDAEAVKFCPVYDQYQAEITKIGETRFALIKGFCTTICKSAHSTRLSGKRRIRSLWRPSAAPSAADSSCLDNRGRGGAEL